MKDGIIFGAGVTGKKVYGKLSLIYHIVGYADNNSKLWGQEFNGVPVIEPAKLQGMDCDVIICSDYYKEIREQLLSLGISRIRMIEPWSYLMYEYHPTNHMKPVELPEMYPPFHKENNTIHILFVQQQPCIRTHKIAELLVSKGIEVSLACIAEHPEKTHPYYASQYKNIPIFFSANDLLSYVNLSDYDLVHCSNEPDSWTCLMQMSNKPVVHDTHDIMSLCYEPNRDTIMAESMANLNSDGMIYADNGAFQLAKERYHIDLEKAMVVENRPSNVALVENRLRKLSEQDGNIHCVYEGSIVAKQHCYFMEEKWLKLANAGVHIHFYTLADVEYCKKLEAMHPNLHYEGSVDSSRLIQEMTKYDCGLLLFYYFSSNWLHTNVGIPNKLYEYLAAGLPVVTDDTIAYRAFLKKYCVGAVLDMERDIKQQIEAISKIKIEENFISKNKLTMRDYADDLVDFYLKTIKRYHETRKEQLKR